MRHLLRHGETEQHCRAIWTKRKCCSNVAQFGHCVGGQSRRKICCRNVSACSNIFWQHLPFSSMFPSLAIMLGNNSTQPSKWQKSTCAALKCAQCTVQTKWPLLHFWIWMVWAWKLLLQKEKIMGKKAEMTGSLGSRVSESMPWLLVWSRFSNFHLHLRCSFLSICHNSSSHCVQINMVQIKFGALFYHNTQGITTTSTISCPARQCCPVWPRCFNDTKVNKISSNIVVAQFGLSLQHVLHRTKYRVYFITWPVQNVTGQQIFLSLCTRISYQHFLLTKYERV